MGERQPAALGEEAPMTRRERSRRRRRWPLALLAGAIVAFALVLAAGAILALAGDPAGAQRSFAEAERHFADGERAATTGVGRVASDMPALGRNLVVAA